MRDLAGGFLLGSAKNNLSLAASAIRPTKSDVEKQKYNQQKSKEYLGIDTDINKIHRFAFSSNSKAVSKDNVANTTSVVNVKILSMDEKREVINVRIAAPIQAAVKLVKSPERTLSFDGLKNMFIEKAYSRECRSVNADSEPVRDLLRIF